MSSTARSPRSLAITLLVLLLLGGAALLFLPGEEARAGGKERVVVPAQLIHFDDGDSIDIRWRKEPENVRIIGIDTPEVQHLEHDLPYSQPFGHEAAGFLRGCIAVADKIELLRSGKQDKYGRTLGYLFLDGKNYSVLAIRARLAYGPNPRFGDNGLPEEHAACLAAAAAAGPVAFEEPWLYRKRMRAVAAWMKENGTYPGGAAGSDEER